MIQKRTQQGFAHVLPLLLIVALAIGGAGYYVMKHQKSTKLLNSETATPETTLATPLPTDLLSVEKIKVLATAQNPAASVLGLQLENENGTLVFKVKLSDNTVVAYNAKTGEVVKSAVEADLEGLVVLPAGSSPSIDFAKARDIAMAQMSGSTVKKIELEIENGVLVYSVRFKDAGRVDVDASTGSIIKIKTDNKAENKNASTSGNSSTDSHKSGTSGSSTQAPSSHDSTETHTTTNETETHSTATTDSSSHGGTSGSGTSTEQGSGSGSEH